MASGCPLRRLVSPNAPARTTREHRPVASVDDLLDFFGGSSQPVVAHLIELAV
jgi:hypothetical protein